MTECNFREVSPRDTWVFGPTAKGKMKSPEYGAGKDGISPAGNRAIKRCPTCNKRLKLWAGYCIGGEFSVWMIPRHSVRETRRPGPKRKSNIRSRGK